jgi:GntR family transcriptional regulator/MocR family aminotransferase
MVDTGIAWYGLFAGLNRDLPSLQVQIRHCIVGAIEDRRLVPGTRLPSSRWLAQSLCVSRVTVMEACQQLVDEGYLVARERSGIFVADLGPGQAGGQLTPTTPSGWHNRFVVCPSRFRHIVKPRGWQESPYPFLFGQLDPALFPAQEWRESVKAASSVAGINGWAGDMIDEDDPQLIEQLRQQVLPRRAIWATENEVMITLGAQHALSLVIRLLVGPHTPAGIEEPGYPDARHMMRMQTDRLHALTVDADGVVPDDVFRTCRVALITPGHHCPTTAAMPQSRRVALLSAARAADCVLIEDDYDSGLMLEIEAPPLKSQDTDGRVIYIGSLSKVLAPGLRVGYVVAPLPVIRELRALRRIMLRHPPSNNQRAMAMFIALGHYRAHLRRLGQVLAERAAQIDRLLPTVLPDCTWRRDAGASSYWITGPESLNARTFAERARTQGVLIEPGDVFFNDVQRGHACFRLGFSAIRTDRIDEGLHRLGAAMRGIW